MKVSTVRALPSPHRRLLESAVVDGRQAAEAASLAALQSLGVTDDRVPAHLSEDQRVLRRGLRAKLRQLGGEFNLLVAECAYEQWHRLLFARFLAENQLLLHPQYHAPMSIAECDDLAADLGEPDGWSVAARFAAEILPGIFRLDDPCVRLRLAPEGRLALERVVSDLPAQVFKADDSLGWVYQFWQKEKKDEVNSSERKIGGADLGPVTQLFTENYMVRFLLENSLGAWWASRHPDSPLVKDFSFLRFDEGGQPAAGAFEGWPDRVSDVTVMDPCCGSGHFLVEAFGMLWRMRAEEEGVDLIAAQDAVLQNNLFGLELDPRCVEIAMFAVALTAWKEAGYRELPIPHVACSGLPVKAAVSEWQALAGGDQRLGNALTRLHILFRDADTLGSLIDPKRAVEISDPTGSQQSFEDADWDEVAPLLESLAAREANDPATGVLGADAASIARAAGYLSRQYTLVTTNPPFLGRRDQAEPLKAFCEGLYPESAANLATVFLERAADLLAPAGTYAMVSPQDWLFLGTYQRFRKSLLGNMSLVLLARLGPGAFESITGEVVQVILTVVHQEPPRRHSLTRSVDVAELPVEEKREGVSNLQLFTTPQLAQLENPDSRIVLAEVAKGPLLSDFASVHTGLQTGDNPRYRRMFWELPAIGRDWERELLTVDGIGSYMGHQQILRWDMGAGALTEDPGAVIRGLSVWGEPSVAVRLMGALPATLYQGGPWDQTCGRIVPRNGGHLPAIWAFCSSDDFREAVRTIDWKKNVTPATLVKIPFDLQRWQQTAEMEFPSGLPKPWSDDPMQWLFEGRPDVSTAPLQVAVGRLLGYRWPEQLDSDDLDGLADEDGIVCLPSVAGEPQAAERLQRMLRVAFGSSWSPSKPRELLERSGSKKKNLEDWLRDDFFKQHCKLFQNRPFIWQIWDGRKDGFSALVNYHRLDRKTLEKLTYTYLGQDWVERQRAERRVDVAGAEARLAAALNLQRKLEAILEGEPPFDVYVRWKSLAQQPIGWDPDLNDGVRLSIRPFVEAGVLRSKFNVHWRKDRGKNPDGSERHNDAHLSRAEKLRARKEAGMQ